jgi:hypothetical protein
MVLPCYVLHKVRVGLEPALIVEELRDFGTLHLDATAQLGIVSPQRLAAPIRGPRDQQPAHKHGSDERQREVFNELVFPGICHGVNYTKNFSDSPLTISKNMR